MAKTWQDQIVQMAAESSGYPRPREAECTKECWLNWAAFEEGAYEALQRWVRMNPGQLVEGEDENSLWEDEGPYLIYMTLAGEGVGIWDGSWDEYFKDDAVISKSLQPFLENQLAQEYQDLEFAINEAAYDTAGGEESEQPSEGELYESYVIRDARGGGYDLIHEGKVVESVDAGEFDEAVKIAVQMMDREKFWPNLYYINERGNIDLLDKDGNIIKSWV